MEKLNNSPRAGHKSPRREREREREGRSPALSLFGKRWMSTSEGQEGSTMPKLGSGGDQVAIDL
ncbi:unnamed protein product [Prunus armeniaca]|uniref:Uncharacterized protein n=1 Tax=Prunus armeniaca TaxID=36596 RepID=A0A6J5Y566_PRUAR|nr:unnamed protein product [Prunus armeniaca]